MSVCEDDKCDITGEPIKKSVPKLVSKGIKEMVSCDFTGKEADNCIDINIEMITQKTCSWCDYAKEHLEKAKALSNISLVDVNSPKVDKYLDRNMVKGTPTYIINNNEICDLKEDVKKDRLYLQCKNGSKVYL